MVKQCMLKTVVINGVGGIQYTTHHIDYLIKELCNLTYTPITLSNEEIIGKTPFSIINISKWTHCSFTLIYVYV